MILEEETFEKFGYYSTDWKPKSGKKVVAVCDDCGKIRIIRKSQYRALCLSCSQKGERSVWFGTKGAKHPLWKGRVMRICEFCGIEFPVAHSQIKKGRGKFCSRECKARWLSKYQRGENNHNWKNGASFEPYCEKFNDEFKEDIRDKFGRVCFLCQKTEEENGKKLSVHHVNGNKNCGLR